MPYQADYNPSNISIGSDIVELGGGFNNMPNTTYYMESFSPAKSATVLDIPDPIGRIQSTVIIDTHLVEATATLQYYSGSALPRIGATGSFVQNFAATGSIHKMVVTSVSQPHVYNDYGRLEVGLRTAF